MLSTGSYRHLKKRRVTLSGTVSRIVNPFSSIVGCTSSTTSPAGVHATGTAKERRPSVTGRTDRAGEHGRDGIVLEVDATGRADPGLADRVQIARNEQWNTAAHRGCRLQQTIVLGAPTRLPVRLWLAGGHAAVSFHVRIPFAPFAGTPTCGVDGILITCAVSGRAMRSLSQASTSGGTNTALGPCRVR